MNALNRFFSDGHRQLQNGRQPVTTDEPPHRTAIDHGANQFNFRPTSGEEICRKLYDIQTNATGSDGIPISFVKLLCPFILPHLCHLINEIIQTKSFPSNWKKSLRYTHPETS